EGVGKMTGDAKTEAEGQADQVKGKAQNAVGGMKDKAREPSRSRGFLFAQAVNGGCLLSVKHARESGVAARLRGACGLSAGRARLPVATNCAAAHRRIGTSNLNVHSMTCRRFNDGDRNRFAPLAVLVAQLDGSIATMKKTMIAIAIGAAALMG
ncbi:hypothetical protein KXV85_004398, partial [Aspergillus fumigatus]